MQIRLKTSLGIKSGKARIFIANDDEGQKVVIKAFPTEARADYETERTCLSRLKHPNIIRLLDSISDPEKQGGYYFLILEYILAQKFVLNKDNFESIIAQISSGFETIHAAGIIHRDIKPENIILGHNGQIRIIDFGVATTNGIHERIVGTSKYCAPEVFLRKELGPCTDVYSLAATFADLIGILTPTPAIDLTEVPLSVVIAGHAIFNKKLVDGLKSAQIPQDIKRTLLDGVTYEPGKRIRSAKELCEKILDALKRNREIFDYQKRFWH